MRKTFYKDIIENYYLNMLILVIYFKK